MSDAKLFGAFGLLLGEQMNEKLSLKEPVQSDGKHELTMAMSCELLAWAMPKMLVVCITSTEKLGSQLAMRDPVGEHMDFLL